MGQNNPGDELTERSLPGAWYGDPDVHQRLIERALLPSWQPGPDLGALAQPGDAVPWRLGPGSLDEPVLTVRQADGGLTTLSNACTHRGALLVDRPCRVQAIRCPYHGRRFHHDGRLAAAPGFPDLPEGADLPTVRSTTVGPLVMATLGDGPPLQDLVGAAWDRIGPLLERPMTEAASSPAYTFDANFLLYIENYLEGLHVPFVHPGLARSIDLASYAVEVLPRGVLQVALASDGAAFDLPVGHPDHGQPIAAYYLWLYPDLMLNLYPWGLSLNHVQPLGPRRTRVVYRTWIADPSRVGEGAGGDLGTVEAEDQQVVLRVQAAVGARLYKPGVYAPGHEDGVRALHRWVREDCA